MAASDEPPDASSAEIGAVISEHQRWLFESVRDGAPSYVRACEGVISGLRYFPRCQPVDGGHRSVALHRLANHVANDGFELMVASLNGSGRSAMRAARSLFEAAISTHDILAGREACERYAKHDAVAELAAADLHRVRPHLSPKGRRSWDYRRKKTKRDAGRKADAAIRRWGKGWATQWSPDTIKDRAERAGMLDDYESFYRLASHQAHVTGGGLLGTATEIDGGPVHRYGPSLQASIVAVIYGTAYMREIVEQVGPFPQVQPAHDALSELADHIDDYGAVMLDLDAAIWPQERPLGPIVVVRMTAHGEKWYLHDWELKRVIEAEPPEQIPPAQQQSLDGARSMLKGRDVVGEPLVIGVIGVHVEPKTGAAWRPDVEILVMPPLFPPRLPGINVPPPLY